MGIHFAANAKMVLINNDQWIIAHIVLDVWVTVKNLNHPTRHYYFRLMESGPPFPDLTFVYQAYDV